MMNPLHSTPLYYLYCMCRNTFAVFCYCDMNNTDEPLGLTTRKLLTFSDFYSLCYASHLNAIMTTT